MPKPSTFGPGVGAGIGTTGMSRSLDSGAIGGGVPPIPGSRSPRAGISAGRMSGRPR